MSSTPRPPLEAEERAMAGRLARLGARAEPSAALDDRILASAHAAVGSKARTAPRRTQPRWPMAVGIAATLALAIGVAWQLRPDPDSQQVYSEAPRSLPTGDAAEADTRAFQVPDQPAPAPLPPQAVVGSQTEQAVAEQVADHAEAADRDERRVMASEPTPESARNQASDAAADSATPPDPPVDAAREAEEASAAAPTAFPAQTRAGAEQQSTRSLQQVAKPVPEIVMDAPSPVAAPPPAAPPARTRSPAAEASSAESEQLDKVEVTGSRVLRDNEGYSDAELDDQPPATADSPKVREAWLRRIRELVAAGEIEAARANLDEFKRRYPRYALPEDLHALHQNTLGQDATAEPAPGDE